MYSKRAREILKILESATRIHQLSYGQTTTKTPHGGVVPPTELVRACFQEAFGEGSRRTPGALTPMACLLDAVMRRTLLPRGVYHEGLTHF